MKDSGEPVKSKHELLNLSVAQLICIVNEGNQSINELTEAFVFISSAVEKLVNKSQTGTLSEELPELEGRLTSMHERIQQSIVAFQFYDRMSQKLNHVTTTLMNINALDDSSPEQQWAKIKNAIAQSYTMESERIVFERIMAGESIERALTACEEYQDRPNDDNVELF